MNQKRGFTLIEMLIVIAIIAILSAIVLTGVTGFQASARDTARIGDLKNIQDYLELYYNKCGFYPGQYDASAGTCTAGTPGNAWATLAGTMASAGVTSQFPTDPLPARSFCYATNVDGQEYVLGTVLESGNSVLNNNGTAPSDITAFTIVEPSGQTQCAIGGTGNTYIVSS